LGELRSVALSLQGLADVSFGQRDFASARTLYDESFAISRELGDKNGMATSLNCLGNLACESGDLGAAVDLYRESLEIFRDLGRKIGVAYSLEGIAVVVAAVAGPPGAARIWGAAQRLLEETGSVRTADESSRYDQSVAAARAALCDDVAFDRAWQEGRALTLDQAIELALEKTVGQR
jgi:hypothetical protein